MPMLVFCPIRRPARRNWRFGGQSAENIGKNVGDNAHCTRLFDTMEHRRIPVFPLYVNGIQLAELLVLQFTSPHFELFSE